MTIAFTCVLIAVVLPQLWGALAKKDLVKNGTYDNSASRPQLASLQGAAQRAKWAEQNSYETLPAFIAAVIIAHLAGASQGAMDLLAVVYVVARVLYGVCYLKDWATARSLVWVVSFLAIIGLFVAAY